MGGEIQGCQMAEFLVKRGRRVAIVETSDELGNELVERKLKMLIRWFAKKWVMILTGVKYEAITDKGLTIIPRVGERQTIEADTIVPVLPLRSNKELFEILKGRVPEVHIIGDAREPHVIMEAIHDGSRVGRAV